MYGQQWELLKQEENFIFIFYPKKKDIESLLSFNFDLPKVERYYTDGNFVYSNLYGDKVIQEKSKYINLVEN